MEARRNWSCRSSACAGCSCCWDATCHAEAGASADRHCRSRHNISAGCCVASGETLASATVGASATGVAAFVGSHSSSASSATGLREGDRDAGFTVLLVVDGMDWNICSSEPAPLIVGPSCELKSCCENVTGGWRRPSNDGEVLAPPVLWIVWSSSMSRRFICCAWRSAASSSLFLCSRPSTSRRFRSRED